MKTPAPWLKARFLPLTLLLGAAACGSEGQGKVEREDFAPGVAQANCESWFACGCNAFGDQGYSDEQSCYDFGVTTLEERAREAEAAGLVYDATCPANFIGALDTLACDNDWYRANQSCEICKSFHGDAAEGESCTSYPEGFLGGFSTCAQGLSCERDPSTDTWACTDPCKDRTEYLEAGDPCDGADADQCLVDLACGASGTCESAPELGEACPDLRCNHAYCDQEASGGPRCVALLPNGSGCDADRQCETRDCRFGLGNPVCTDSIPLACRYYNY